MNRIGIVTFHCVDNYGAVLQCLALSEFLKKSGFEPEVINYCPEYHLKPYKVFRNPITDLAGLSKEGIITILKKTFHDISSNVLFLYRWKLKKKYIRFRKNFLVLTKRVSNQNDLRSIGARFQAVIVGSDQVWNSKITGGSLDPTYFLNFVDLPIKKISYAASAGGKIDDKYVNDFPPLLQDIQYISVREKILEIQINQLTGRNVVTTIDPTLLLTKNQWEKFAMPTSFNQKYILIYSMEKNKVISEISEIVARKKDIDIIEICTGRSQLKNRSKIIRSAGPEEFLSLIQYAEYVITNSFHGMVFSIMFHKQFTVIPHSVYGERMSHLVSELGLEERLLKNCFSIDEAFRPIDYQKVDLEIERLRQKSKKFLLEALIIEN